MTGRKMIRLMAIAVRKILRTCAPLRGITFRKNAILRKTIGIYQPDIKVGHFAEISFAAGLPAFF